MVKFLTLLLCSCLLAACSHDDRLRQDNRAGNRGYFADASTCSQSAMRHESIKVPTAGSVSVVDVPVGHDTDKFMVCMEYAGRPVSRADASQYVSVSNACLDEARSDDNPDDAYADCIRRSRLNVELIPNE